jgi:hypothetical protein
LNFDDPLCAVVVIGLALRCAPGQTNKQNRECYRSSEMGIVSPSASWRGIFSRKNNVRHCKPTCNEVQATSSVRSNL